MALAQPPGVRSCRASDGTPGKGGEWTHCVPDSKVGYSFLSDLDSELSSTSMAESDLKVYKRELLNRMKRAERGELIYGPDARHHDVFDLSRSRNQLLELRHNDVTTVDDSGEMAERHARLYFAERAQVCGELLSVAFFTKAPGPIGLDEQDEHIDRAMARLMRHEMTR